MYRFAEKYFGGLHIIAMCCQGGDKVMNKGGSIVLEFLLGDVSMFSN